MKRFILSFAAICCILPLLAQASVNYYPESLSGSYTFKLGDEPCTVTISRCEDESFKAVITSMDGKDVTLEYITGLKYNEEKKCWSDGKVFDVHKEGKKDGGASMFFEPDGRLCVKHSVKGIGHKSYWKRAGL